MLYIYKIIFQTYQYVFGLNIQKKKHLPGYSYLRPSSHLVIRLNQNNQLWLGEKPVSFRDQLALHYDIAYRNTEMDQSKGLKYAKTVLHLKHDVDSIMIEQLDQIPTTKIIDKLANFNAKKI